MAIIKEKNGTYTLHYTKVDVLTNKTTRTRKRGFVTLKDAKAFEKSLSREHNTVLFKTLFYEYINSRDIVQSTKEDYLQLFKQFLSDMGEMTYEDLTKSYFLEFRNYISSLERSSSRKNRVLILVKSTCKYANDIYDLPNNAKVMKSFKKEKHEMEIWTPEEFARFEDAIKERYDNFVPFFHLLFWTGMRKGEARALQIDDLDLNNATITISKSMRRYGKSLKAPKTESSKRKIKIDKITLELLLPLKSNEKWLFGDYRPISLTTIDVAFKYGTEKANLKKIRIHDLRHSHATYLICNGANIVAVSKRLGHSNINMTLSTYTHLLKNVEDEVIEIIDNCGKQNQ